MSIQQHVQAWVHPGKRRYYRVYLERDLLGDWVVRTVWGGIASRRGRMVSSGVGSYEEGLSAIRAIGKRRAQRGYSAVV
jgi:hypothetical protein